MAKRKGRARIFDTKYFGLILGLIVFALVIGLSYGTTLVRAIELKTLDFNFRMKNTFTRTRAQEGVSVVQQNPRISQDILIVGIDDKTLARFGKWPFPRSRTANLIDSFARVADQGERERALFIDVFYIEPDKVPADDAVLVRSIRDSGRVFLETVLTLGENPPDTDEEFFGRQDVLSGRLGTITNIRGDWVKVNSFLGLQPPLKPYARAAYGYGHANFLEDGDQVYRRQPLVVKLSRLVEAIPLDELTPDYPVDRANFERLAWIDTQNRTHEVPWPLTAARLADLVARMEKSAPFREETSDDGTTRKFHVVRKYRDSFLPSITFSLALEYMHKKLSDAEVVLGEYIRIRSPEIFDADTQSWVPYRILVTPAGIDEEGNVTTPATYREVPEVRIPIDETGAMLINFMGGRSSANPEEHQTYPVRSFSGYAANPPGPDPARWPPTKKVGNTILMVGPFSQGMAADEKPSPFGLMYGVEIHANALNTILMGNFLNYAEEWVTILILFGVIMLTAFLVSRPKLQTLWSLVVTAGMILVYFFVFMLVFELSDYIINFSGPAAGAFLTFLAVVAYRTATEEREKRHIRDMFGKYVSPDVVDQILERPPELGGEDKELTVFFSDIRGFTTLSERMTPQELVNHLNLYLTAMTDLILLYKGTLDKYVGDEVMCFWGAPLPQPDHALLACKCALKQLEVLKKMNESWSPERQLSIGIGVNTGIMTVGNMGSMGRMNYTLMGDMVNLGARLEGTNKQYTTSAIISEFTYAQVRDRVVARELDNIRVKGKNKSVVIYELIDVIEGLEPPVETAGKGTAAAKKG
jgi:adenylate cyclase